MHSVADIVKHFDVDGRERSPEGDESDWELARTLCPSSVTSICNQASNPESACQRLASEHPSSQFLTIHHDCTDKDLAHDDEENLDFAIFGVCRQIYHEVFPWFWQTNEFCFESEALGAFLRNLTKVQTDTIRHIAILHYVDCALAGSHDWDSLYLDTLEQWTLGQDKNCPPNNLSSLEIHLQLFKSNYITPTTTKFQMNLLQVVLRAFSRALGELCTQDVDRTSINISYHKPSSAELGFDKQLTKDETSNLTASFRDRISHPTRSGDTLTTDAMASKLLTSERTVDRLEQDAVDHSEKAAIYKQKAEECRYESDIEMQKSIDLRGTFRRRLSIEIKNEANWQNGGGRGDIE